MPNDPKLTPIQNAEVTNLPDDEQIRLLFTQWKKDCEPYHDELVNVAELSREYYKGIQTNMAALASYESHAVENRLFLADETAVPLITTKLPEIQVTPGKFNEESVNFANKLENVITYLMQITDVQHKGEVSVRTLSHNRFFVWHPFWNEEKGEIDFRYVPTRNCWFPRYSAFPNQGSLPYFIELQEYELNDLVDAFGKDAVPHVDQTLPENAGIIRRVLSWWSSTPTAPDDRKGKYFVWAVWTKKWVAYVGKDKVLEKMANPYWRSKNADGTPVKELNEQRKINYFQFPQIPYIIGTVFEDGEETVGITSQAEQVIPMQDTINKVIRYMEDYMETVGDPQILIDPKVMSKEEADQMTSESGRKYIAPGIANPNLFRRVEPPQMPVYIKDLLVIAQQSFDNIYGAHSSTRGEKSGNPTLGQDQLQKDSDIGRMDVPARVLGRAINSLGEWFIQLMMIYYDEKRDIPILDESDELTFVEGFSNEMIQKGMKLQTKLGSSLPDDKVTRATIALKVASLNIVGMRPLDLYKTLGMQDPEGLEQNLVKWNTGQVAKQEAGAPVAPTPEASPAGQVVPPVPVAPTPEQSVQ
jgi:hypothetical protein